MRSRYSAYALGGYGEYLLKTWSPSSSQGLSAEQLSEKTVEWIGLDVISKRQKNDDGFVEFKAYFLDENQQESSMHERSVFQRMNGKWLYLGREDDGLR